MHRAELIKKGFIHFVFVALKLCDVVFHWHFHALFHWHFLYDTDNIMLCPPLFRPYQIRCVTCFESLISLINNSQRLEIVGREINEIDAITTYLIYTVTVTSPWASVSFHIRYFCLSGTVPEFKFIFGFTSIAFTNSDDEIQSESISMLPYWIVITRNSSWNSISGFTDWI